MQQQIQRSEVIEPALSARVGGRELEVSGVSIDRSLPDPLLARGLRAASGEISVLEGSDVVEHVATPWDPNTEWPPAPETGASISMDMGSGPVSLLANGRVVSADGGSSAREVDLEIADAYQSLDRPISWAPFADAMPALTEATDQRLVSLRATAITDRILRHCGWFATPPMLGYCVVSVPAMGTMWPEQGMCLTSTQSSMQGYPPMFTEPWGVGVGDVSATYQRAAEYTIKARGRVEMTAIAGRLTGGTKHLMARTDSFRWARLSWTDTTASVWVTDGAGASTVVVSLPRDLGSFLYATIEYISDTSVRVILRVDGDSVTATAAVHADLTTQPVTVAEISGTAVGGGFQVAFPSFTGELVGWAPNAVVYDRAGSFNALQVVPSVQGANCAELLAQQCEAQAATYWIDETGVLRWWDMARLEARSSVATLTSDDEISEEGFTWSHHLSSVKRSVTVNWKEPLVEGGWRTSVDFWQGRGSTLETTGSNNPAEDWISVPSDEVWLMPDLSLNRIGSSGFEDFNYGWGSHYGAVTRTPDGAEEWAQISGSFIVVIEQVTPTSFKYSTTWTGSRQAIQRTPQGAESGGLWGIRRDFDLPILRGKKKYKVADRAYSAAQSGPSTAPDHVIDAGWWIQNEAQAQWTADYAAARLTVPQPVLSSIALIPIPGLQLGDMVTVVDSAVTRLTIRGTVVEDSRSITADMDLSHAVAIRPVQVSRNGVTWEEWASMTRENWTDWATAEGGTWQQWGTNPLNE